MKHPKSLIFALLTFVLLAACSPNQNEPIVKTTNDLNTLELIGRVKSMTQHSGVNSTGKIYTLFNEQGNIMERGSYRSYDIFNSKAPFEKQVKEIRNYNDNGKLQEIITVYFNETQIISEGLDHTFEFYKHIFDDKGRKIEEITYRSPNYKRRNALDSKESQLFIPSSTRIKYVDAGKNKVEEYVQKANDPEFKLIKSTEFDK
ncbi:MAG: hypothetical protein LBC84_09135, partial [Prevotellaceae bacterium]|nr:hypothetical protein [Prevotellaceae bacterium]